MKGIRHIYIYIELVCNIHKLNKVINGSGCLLCLQGWELYVNKYRLQYSIEKLPMNLVTETVVFFWVLTVL